MEIITLNQNNFNQYSFEDFFNDYPFERYYFKQLGLSHAETIEFLIHNLHKRTHRSDGIENQVWLVLDKGTIQGIFGVAKNTLHSRVYESSIFEIGPIYNFKQDTDAVFAAFNNQLRAFAKNYTEIYFKCKLDSSDHKNIAHLNKAGFDYYATGQKVLYTHEESGEKFEEYYAQHGAPKEEHFAIKQFDKERDDFELLNTLIDQHEKSEHFYNYNDHFDFKKTNELFKEWFSMYIGNPRTQVFQLIDTQQEKVIGFTSFNGPVDIAGKKVYTRDLTIIEQSYRGLGLATLLYKAIVDETQTFIEGSPMVDNYQNLKLNMKCGYSIVQSRAYFKQFFKN